MSSPGYMQDYMFYNTGNEVPEVFHQWAALSLLAAVIGRGISYDRGYFTVYPNIYVAMIGTAGSGKSTAKDIAKTVFVKYFPHLLISSSIQSREDIAVKMAGDESCQTFKRTYPTGIIEHSEYRPFYLIINELSNFLSVDTRKMVDFLVDIFDTNHFSTGFKNSASQNFNNPYVNILACVPPEWIMSNLKMDLFSGGLGRRLILVYGEKKKFIPDPKPPEGGDVAWGRVIEHLREAHELARTHQPFTMSPEGKKWWDRWYMNATARINREDPILRQFHETKHVMLLKISMLVAMNHRPFNLVMTDEHLITALAMLDTLEPNIIRLTSGIGRNELASVAAQMLEAINTTGGVMIEKKLLAMFYRHGQHRELDDVMKHLTESGKVVLAEQLVGTGPAAIRRRMVMTPEVYRRHLEAAEKQKRQNG